MTREATVLAVRSIREQKGDVPHVLARLLEALMIGGKADVLLREMASMLLQQPGAGLDLVEVSLAINDAAVEAWAVKTLLLLECGRLQEARETYATLSNQRPTLARPIGEHLEIMFPRFEFWPSACPLEPHVLDELPDTVTQDSGALRRMIGKGAVRLQRIRDALRARLRDYGQDDQPDWLPPDLAHLCRAEPASLDCYTFEAVFEGDNADEHTVDSIEVNEEVGCDGLSVTELMRRARVEWTALCWLCYSAGMTSVGLPPEVRAPDTFAQAITTAFARYQRLSDQLQTGSLRSKALGIASFEWEGRDIEGLSGQLLQQAIAEYLEMRSALFFAGDESCRSLWQDDLRV